MFGGRVTVWFTDHVGLEGQGAYALSDGEAEQNGEPFECADAGPAVIDRSGKAYDAFAVEDGKTDIGGVVNLGLSFRVASGVSVRGDAEDYISSAKFTDSFGDEIDPKLQNDLTLTAGIQIAWADRGAAVLPRSNRMAAGPGQAAASAAPTVSASPRPAEPSGSSLGL